MGKVELVAFLCLSSLCLAMVFVLCAVDWPAVCDCGIFLPYSPAKCNHIYTEERVVCFTLTVLIMYIVCLFWVKSVNYGHQVNLDLQLQTVEI